MNQLETFKFDDRDSGCQFDGRFWNATSLLRAVKDQRCRVETIHLNSRDWTETFRGSEPLSWIDLAQHLKRCMDTDLSNPIIITFHGQIVDGKHRVLKALALNHKTIKAYRLKYMPDCDRKTD